MKQFEFEGQKNFRFSESTKRSGVLIIFFNECQEDRIGLVRAGAYECQAPSGISIGMQEKNLLSPEEMIIY